MTVAQQRTEQSYMLPVNSGKFFVQTTQEEKINCLRLWWRERDWESHYRRV